MTVATPAGTVAPQTPAPVANTGDPAGQAGTNNDKTVPLAALQEEREKRQSLQAELEKVKGAVAQMQMAHQGGQGQPGGQQFGQPAVQPNRMDDLNRLWEEDPRRAMQAELQMALNWYDQVNLGIETESDVLATKLTDFNTYRDDVRKFVRALPPEQRGNKGVVEMAYYVVKGQKADEIYGNKSKEMADKLRSIEAAQGFSSGGFVPKEGVGPGLTAQETQTALKMGITPEEYLKFKK